MAMAKPAPTPRRGSKLSQFLEWRVRVNTRDTREFVGQLLAFDKHLNLVMGDCEEYRRVVGGAKQDRLSKKETDQKRSGYHFI